MLLLSHRINWSLLMIPPSVETRRCLWHYLGPNKNPVYLLFRHYRTRICTRAGEKAISLIMNVSMHCASKWLLVKITAKRQNHISVLENGLSEERKWVNIRRTSFQRSKNSAFSFDFDNGVTPWLIDSNPLRNNSQALSGSVWSALVRSPPRTDARRHWWVRRNWL